MKNNYQIKIEKQKLKNSKNTEILHFCCYNEYMELLGEIIFQYINNVSIYFSGILDVEDTNKYFPENKATYIKILDVVEKYQNNGIGNYLMQKFLLFSRKNKDYDKIILSAVPFGNKNLPIDLLTKFYEKHNFETISFELIDTELHPIMINTK